MWDFVKYKYTKQFSLQHERIRQQSNLTRRLDKDRDWITQKTRGWGFFPQASLGLKNKRLYMKQRWCCYQVLIWGSVSCLILYPPRAGSSPLCRHLAFWLPLKQSSSWGLLSYTYKCIHTLLLKDNKNGKYVFTTGHLSLWDIYQSWQGPKNLF